MRKTTVALLLALALVWGLASTSCAEAKTLRAPVVSHVGEGAMAQTGWLSYEEATDYMVLYCVQPKDKRMLDCVVYVWKPEFVGVVLLSDIAPTEDQS